MAYILFRICKKKTPKQSDWKIFEKAARFGHAAFSFDLL